MSKDLIATIGVGVSLAGLILYSQHNLRVDLREETRSEVRAVRSEMRSEFKAIRSELQGLRTETQAEFKAVRSEMQAEFKAVRSEMKAGFSKHLEAINRLREDVGELQERVARQEGLMEGLRDAITGSRELVAGPS